MLSNRRRFLQGAAATGVAATAGLWSHAASAKVAPVTLKDRKYEPLKLPRPISLAALTVLDVSPANQVLCAARPATATWASASSRPRRPKPSTT